MGEVFITVPFVGTIDRKQFDCVVHPALNEYIAKQASQDEKRNVSRTFMLIQEDKLVGYYTLANASVVLADLPDDQSKKLPRYPIPAVLLSRLAVDANHQKKGYGRLLVTDFFWRVYEICKLSGAAFVVVDAKDETAAQYYKDLGFVETKTNHLRLVLSTSTIIGLCKELEQ